MAVQKHFHARFGTWWAPYAAKISVGCYNKSWAIRPFLFDQTVNIPCNSFMPQLFIDKHVMVYTGLGLHHTQQILS